MIYNEKLHILKKYIKKEISIKELCSEYLIWRPTIRRIVENFTHDQIRWNKVDTNNQRHLKATEKLIKGVDEFHSSTNQPFVTNNVKKTLQNKYRVNLPAYIIRDTMKEALNLSYKKGKSDL